MYQAVPIQSNQVLIDEEVAYFDRFEERDSEVVFVLAEAEDATEAAHLCLQIGARAVRTANAALDTDFVERRFDEINSSLEDRVTAVIGEIESTAKKLLDEDDGAMARSLQSNREQFHELVEAAFDSNSKAGVVAKLERMMGESQAVHLEKLRGAISLDDEGSPLTALKVDIVRELGGRLAELQSEVQEISTHMAVSTAVNPLMEKSTAKGVVFETIVHERLAYFASGYGDLAQPVGEEYGSAGTKKGDELLTLNRDDTQGRELHFVAEIKNRKLGMRAVMEELEASLINRDALAGIAVFRSQEQAPTTTPFEYLDNKAFVVLGEEGDDAPLRLAYMWARWMARRTLAESSAEGVDLERVSALIADMKRSIERVTNIKRANTTAKKEIEKATGQVEEMRSEMLLTLDELSQELISETN